MANKFLNYVWWFFTLLLTIWLHGLVSYIFLWSAVLLPCIGACTGVNKMARNWLEAPGNAAKNLKDGAEMNCNCVDSNV